MTDQQLNSYRDQTEKPLKNVGVTEEEQDAYLASRPYTARRTGLYKGKFAKPGHAYLVVKVKWKDRNYENFKMFPTEGLEKGVMNHLYDKLYEEIKEFHQNGGKNLKNKKK